MEPDCPRVSFVIPALNEEENVGRTIESIHQASGKASLDYEVILMDHGSTDRTREIAREHGAEVVEHPFGTIGGLRNAGAERASGRILVFLDADVVLTEEWAESIGPVLERVDAGAPIITGSHCSPPDSRNPILRFWFGAMAHDPRNTHLGTGHLILSRRRFDEIGGFDATLQTGEDYEFCDRARKTGMAVEHDGRLPVLHFDYPLTLGAFIRREAWHGRGDRGSLSQILRSKVMMACLVFVVAHVLALMGVVFLRPELIGLGVAVLLILLLGSALIKHRHAGALAVLVNAGIFYFYYLGRTAALLDPRGGFSVR
jgi:glycosyltransferase involved in cell wall biosynthesis